MAPLVSIVVPCFIATERQAQLLAETIATVQGQTLRDYEVIVVDDGSPLTVRHVVAPAAGVEIIRQPNAGTAVARNAGIARSRGDFVVFLDADDHLLPLALESGVAALMADPSAGFAVGPREEMTFEGRPVPWSVPVPPPESDIYRALLAFDWYIIPPSSAIFRRGVVEEVNGFRDPWGADDLDFYLRVAYRHRASCYQAPPVTRYRRYSTSSSRDGARMLQSVRAVYARHWALVSGDPVLEAAHRAGLSALTHIFVGCLEENVHDRVREGWREGAIRAAKLLIAESPDRWRALKDGGGPSIQALALDVEPSPRE